MWAPICPRRRNLNLYPWIVAAYQKDSGTNLYAVARPQDGACWSVERGAAFTDRIQREGLDVHMYKQPRSRAMRSWDKSLSWGLRPLSSADVVHPS